jgi:Phage stabilisation protein
MATVRLPLVFQIQSRKADPFKDSKMVNAYKEGNQVNKRPGLAAVTVTPTLPVNVGQGIFQFNGSIFTAINNNIYKVTNGVSVLIGTITGAVVPLSFTSTFNNNYLFFHNLVNGYYYSDSTGLVQLKSDNVLSATMTIPGSGYTSAPNVVFSASPSGTTATGTADYDSASGAITGITITNRGSGYVDPPTITIDPPGSGVTAEATATLNFFPTDLVPGAAYLDGYVGVMTKNGRVYTSNSNDVTGWNALDYISSNSQPDLGTGLTSHLNYIVAFNQWSTQFFYDAANPTASPLSVNSSANLEIGCANGNSIAKFEQTVVWVGQSNSAGKGVYLLNGIAPNKISNQYIDKYLDVDGVTNCTGYGIKYQGHSWYVLTLPDTDITLVFDIDEKVWSFWSSQIGRVEQYFVGDFSTYYQGITYIQDAHDGELYYLDDGTYTDADGPINFRLVSPLLDADTQDRKFISRVEIVGDKVDTILRIRHTDDDYQHWSQYRNVNLSNQRPVLYQNGTTRRRAYELYNNDNAAIRLDAMEMEITKGDS